MQNSINKLKDSVANRLFAFSLIYISFGAVFYHIVEKFTWVDSFYFTVVTLATVGFGDIHPETTVGKLFTIFYIIIGVSVFVAFARLMVFRIDRRRKRRLSNNTSKNKRK